MDFTDEQVQELIKCKKDIIYFAENYIKINDLDKGLSLIKLYPKQKEILLSWLDNKKNVTLSGRQTGVSTLYGIFLLYNSLFFDKTNVMCCPTQHNCAAMHEYVIDMYNNLPSFIKPSLISSNKETILFANGGRIRFTSLRSPYAIRGFAINNLIMDNIDYVPDKDIKEFFRSVLPMVIASRRNKIIIGGTPLSKDSTQNTLVNHDWNITKIIYTDIPRFNNSEWKESMLKCVDTISFNKEFALEYSE